MGHAGQRFQLLAVLVARCFSILGLCSGLSAGTGFEVNDVRAVFALEYSAYHLSASAFSRASYERVAPKARSTLPSLGLLRTDGGMYRPTFKGERAGAFYSKFLTRGGDKW